VRINPPPALIRLEAFMPALKQISRKIWATVSLAAKKFLRIDGAERAAAFSYNAFFSLFPLVILLVTTVSLFIDRASAGTAVISYLERYVPLNGAMQHYIFDTISGVVRARKQAGAVAVLMLVWVATQFFTTLVHAANKAWNIEGNRWWHLPLKSLTLLGIMVMAVLLGIGVPVLGKMMKDFFSADGLFPWFYNLAVIILPWLVLFYSLTLFYRLAPRRRTRFSEVWPAALCAAALLQAAQSLFVLYLKRFSALNSIYGAFGGIMALLLWIYLSGCVFIFCACLCAAQAETRALPADGTAGAKH